MNNSMLDEKDMLELFNYIGINDKENDDNVDSKMDDLRKKRLRNNLLKQVKGKDSVRKFKYKVAAVAVIAIISICASMPALAKNISALKSIIQVLNGTNGISGDKGEYEKYTKVVDKSVTDNGITLTINEVLCDDSSLMIGYTIKSEGDIKKVVKTGKDVIETQAKDGDFMPFSLIKFLKVDGELTNGSSSSDGKYLDEHSYINSETMDIGNKNLPSVFKVDLDVKDIYGIKGNWSFKFSVSKDEILKRTKVFMPNTKVEFPNATINVEKVSFTPISTSIIITSKYNNKEYKNSEKEKNALKSDEIMENMLNHQWFVFDDKGDEITCKGGSGGITKNTSSSDYKYEIKFVSLKNIPKHLTVIPYIMNFNTDDYKKYKAADGSISIPPIHKNINGVYPIEISQGKIGKLIIKEIKIEKDMTIVKYTVDGTAPFLQAKELRILDDNDNVIEGKDNFEVKKDKNNPSEYIMEFEPLDKNKKYKIGTNDLGMYEIRADLKFTINLSN